MEYGERKISTYVLVQMHLKVSSRYTVAGTCMTSASGFSTLERVYLYKSLVQVLLTFGRKAESIDKRVKQILFSRSVRSLFLGAWRRTSYTTRRGPKALRT